MGQERRRFARTPEPFAIQYRPANQPAVAWCRVTVINLSAGGIRFRCTEEPLEAGTPLQIDITLPGLREPMMLNASVIWNQLQASGVTEVGAQFQGLDRKQQLLIDRLVGFLRTSV